MKKYSLSALLAAGLLAGAATSASAADLGGNCCADLEERIAELEATTVRKGNRKVSLTISGWVAEQVLWWDDGKESNAYVTGLGATLSSHFKLNGEAQIRPGLKAGYLLHIEAGTADPLNVNQRSDDGANVGGGGRQPNTLGVLQSYWYLKDDHWGQISVGQLSHASDNAALLVDGSGSLVPANWVLFDNFNFNLRVRGVLLDGSGGLPNLNWASLAHCGHVSAGLAGDCNGVPNNAVRYDSPTFAGFSVSASWGEDDFWDVTGRWAGEHSGFKLAFAASWSQNNDESLLGGSSGTPPVRFLDRRDSGYFQFGGYIQHLATGLFVYGAYGKEFNDNLYVDANATRLQPDGDVWYLKAGIRQKWTPFGATVLYGHYSERNDMFDPVAAAGLVGGAATSVHSKLTEWGVGAVQEIDAAAMSLFLNYKHFDGEASASNGRRSLSVNADDFQLVKFGALINF